MGYGASTVGGRGGTVSHPTSLAQLRSALSASGPRIIALPTSRQTWDLAGNDLMLNKPFVTLDGGAIIFKGGAVKVTASQVIIQNLTSHAGDQSGNPADVDALTVNGNSACIDHIVLNHVEGLWGPDIGGLAILGCVHDVTVQYGIFGEGLFRSDHPKSTDSPDGHALAFNIADDVGSPAQRVTVYGNLLTTSQGRNPRVIGAYCTDLIDNVIYNYVEGPSGNPHSLNVIGNTFEAGPAPAAAGLTMRTEEWRFASDANVWTKLIPDATFVSGNRAIGFSFSAPSGDNLAVRRDAPACAPSVRSVGAPAAYGMVLQRGWPSVPQRPDGAPARERGEPPRHVLQRRREISAHADLAVSRALVTGGAGFIGSTLAERLLADGWEVVTVDSFDDFYARPRKLRNLRTAQMHPGFELIEADTTDAAALAAAFDRARPDVVFDLAARAGVRPSIADPDGYVAANVVGLQHTINNVARHGARLVFASSSSIYGVDDRLPFREDQARGRPISPYGATKVAGEALCHAHHAVTGLPVGVARLFTVFGPRQRPDLAIHAFARRILAGEPIELFDQGKPLRDYTYVDDLVDALVRMARVADEYLIVNLGSDHPVTVSQMVAELERALGTTTDHVLLPPQPGDVPGTHADVRRARERLGWQPTTSFSEGIDRFGAWLKAELAAEGAAPA